MAGVQSGEEIKDWTWGLTWEVKREYNNFDLCIVEGNSQGDIEEVEDSQDGEMSCGEYDEEPQDDVLCGRILFVLENKVKSIPYEDQLERYAKEAEELNRKNFYKEAAKEVNMVKSRIIDNTKLLMGDSFQDWYLKERGRGKNKKWYKWSKDEENWHELNQNVIPNNTVEISVKTYSAKRAEEQKKSQFVIFYCLWLRIFPISLMAMFGKLR